MAEEPRVYRAVATEAPPRGWWVYCRCPQRRLWQWASLPEGEVPCPVDGCPHRVVTVAVRRYEVRVSERHE